MGVLRKAWDWIGDSFGWSGGQFHRLYTSSESDSGEAVTPTSSMQTVVVLRCATLIAGAAASLPIDVYRRRNGTREGVPGHPVETKLDSEPNPDMSSMDFRAQQWLSFLLWGNAYAHVVRDGARVVALWPLFPMYMEMTRDKETREILYKYAPPAMLPYVYRADEILHVRWYSMDGLMGMSAIEQARNAIGLHRSTEKSAGKFFKNGSQLNLQLEIPAALTPKVVDQLREDFQKEYGGTEKAFRIAISHGGSKLSPIAVNPRDSQFLEQREYNDIQICMLFGVPPHMAGITSKVTSWGTGIAEQKQGFLDFTVAPLLTFFEKAYERCLLQKSEERLYIKHNTKAFLRADVKARYDAYAIAVERGLMNRDECRALEEENPIPGGAGSMYTIQSSYIPLEQAGKSPAPPSRPEGGLNG
jgi:HK97 family phage portal protein